MQDGWRAGNAAPGATRRSQAGQMGTAGIACDGPAPSALMVPSDPADSPVVQATGTMGGVTTDAQQDARAHRRQRGAHTDS